MVKLDTEAAYYFAPIRAKDSPLLGMWWEGSVYLDTMLPFGLVIVMCRH